MAEPITLTKVKKNWFKIVAPKSFEGQVLGESYVSEPNALVGKKITVNLSDFTGDVRQQSVNITFRITGIKDGAAETEVESFTTSPSMIKRLVRRQTIRLDDVIKAETADNKDVEIKFFIITKSLVRSATIKALRNTLRNETLKTVKKTSFEDLFRALVTNKFQMQLKGELKKIYPLKSCEIKKMTLIDKEHLQQKLNEQESKKEKRKEPKAKKEDKKADSKKEIKESEEEPEKEAKKAEEKQKKGVEKEGKTAKKEETKDAPKK